MLASTWRIRGKDAMAVPLLDLHEQHATLGSGLHEAFEQVLESDQFILGPFVEQFERHLAQYTGASHVVGVSSGTDALLMSMMALGIEPEDEVITTPLTFFCTAGCVMRLGARPVFVDIDPQTLNLDVEQVETAITTRTRAILPVHLFGLPVQMDRLMQLSRLRDLLVIEDAAQALGARFASERVGAMGTVGCYSFYPTKNLAGLGDAGAIVTSDDVIAERLRLLRVHGSDDGVHYRSVGGNFRLDALQAAMLSVKLPWLDHWSQRRRAHAARYNEHLAALPLILPSEPVPTYHVYNQYTVLVPGGQRDALAGHLAAQGIGNRVYYSVPLHLQPALGQLGYMVGDFPHAERAANEVISLPVFPEMTEQQQDTVIDSIGVFFDDQAHPRD